MSELIVGIILSLLFLVHLAIARYLSIPNETVLFALFYVIALDVAPMSHLWHILYGEDRISCSERKGTETFGWTPCFSLTWNTFVNTYEITLSATFIILPLLTFYVLFRLFKNVLKNTLVYVLTLINLVFGAILLLSTPDFLDGFEDTFNWSGFVISTIVLVLVEVYVRLPYFGYVRV